MAVAVIVQAGTREQYDAVAERINADGIPDGAIVHTATETPDGVRMSGSPARRSSASRRSASGQSAASSGSR